MPINDIYANPIEQSSKNSVLGIGIPRSRTTSVFGGRGQEVMEIIQLVPINYGMLNAPPNLGPGPTGTGSSGTGGTGPYPTIPYPGANPTANTTGSYTYGNPSLTGTVTYNSGSTAVTGVGTTFTSQVLVGDVLYDVNNQIVVGTVSAINSDTSITLTANAGGTAAGATVRTGDSIGSQYRIFNSVPAKYYLDDIIFYGPAIAGATGFNLGTYKAFFGPVVNASSIGTGLDFSTAHNYPTPLQAANNLSIIQRSEPLWEIDAGQFDKEPNALDIVLTSTVAPTAAGVVYCRSRWITPVS